MTDKKMTRAEMAAQMGVSENAFARIEAGNMDRLAANRTPVKPAETSVRATTEEPTQMDRLRDTLTNAYNAAATTVKPIVEPIVNLGRDLKDGLDRGNTNDSNNNRLTEQRMRASGVEAPRN